MVDDNSTDMNRTIVNINGTMYLINGTLTKLNKTKVDNLSNKVVGGMLDDVKSANQDSTEHMVNDTQAGVTTDGTAGQLFSYDGASSTTLVDGKVPEKTPNSDVTSKTDQHSQHKIKNQGNVNVSKIFPLILAVYLV